MWPLMLVVMASLSLSAADDIKIIDPDRGKPKTLFEETTTTWTTYNKTFKPSTSASKTIKSSTFSHVTFKPSISASDIIKPSTSASDIIKPSTSASEIITSRTSASEIITPSISTSETSQASTSTNETFKPSTFLSETFKPSFSVVTLQPSTSASETSQISAREFSKLSTTANEDSNSSDWITYTAITANKSGDTSSQIYSTFVETTTLATFTRNCNQTFNSYNDNSSGCAEQELKIEKPRTQFYIYQTLADEIRKVLSFLGFGLCILGLVTNSLNIAVFSSNLKNSTNSYLISIAALGIVSSAILLVSDVYVFAHGTTAYGHHFFLSYNILSVSLYLKPVTQRSLYLIILLVSIERFLVVNFPLKAKEFIFSRFPKTTLILAILTVAIFHIFSPLKGTIKDSVDTTTNGTIYSYAISEIYKQDPDGIIAASLASKIIFVYIVLLAGLLTNLLVVCALRRHSNTTKKMRTNTDTDKAARQERRITVTIITSSLVMLVLALPLNTGSVLRSLLPHLLADRDAPYRHLYSVTYSLSTTLVTLSLSTDFLTYMTLSKGFRRTCLKLLHISQKDDTQTAYSTGQTQVSSLETKL